MQEDLSSLGGRLRWAIQQRPPQGNKRGVNLFQADLVARSAARAKAGHGPLAGITLPTIRTYLPLKGQPARREPSPSFLREAADLCGVSFAWLVSGEGAPTEAHRAVAGIATRSTYSSQGARLQRAAFTALGLPVPQPHGGPGGLAPWTAALGEVWVRLVAASVAAGAGQLDAQLEAKIGAAVAAPLKALGIKARDVQRSGVLADYLFAVTPALLILARQQQEQATEDAPPPRTTRKAGKPTTRRGTP
jgi:hypothetical protein